MKHMGMIRQRAKNQMMQIGIKLAQVEWQPNQRKYLNVIRIIAESTPREEIILAVVGKKGASDIEATDLIRKIQEVVNDDKQNDK